MNQIRKIIFIAFGASLAILLLLSFLFYQRTETYDKHIDSIAHSSEILLQLEKINGFWMESSRSIRNYLLLGKIELLDPYYESKLELNQHIDTIGFLISRNPKQKKLIQQIAIIAQKRFQIIDSFILVNDLREHKKIEFLGKMENVANQFRSLFIQMREEEEIALKNRQQIKTKFENVTPLFLLSIFIFTITIFIISFWILIRNMDKRIEIEQELQKKLIILDQANEELENLTIVTSHHIQEPTRKIRNFSTMFQSMYSGTLDQEAKSLLKRIEQNAGHLQNLFINLVQYSNVIRVSEQMELTDLNMIIEKSKNNLEEMIIKSGAIIHYNQLPAIICVRNHIQLLFDELIRNAIQFASNERVPEIFIQHQYESKDRILSISIEDNGIGFPNEYAFRIFKLFEQLNPFKTEGKGIGLTMCSRIMANHGGSIDAKGNPDKGSSFTIRFNQA